VAAAKRERVAVAAERRLAISSSGTREVEEEHVVEDVNLGRPVAIV
jgi:hypothetical protein